MMQQLEPEMRNVANLTLDIDQLRSQRQALLQFFHEGIALSFEGCDWDGGAMQEEALALGLIRAVPYDPAVHDGKGMLQEGEETFEIVESYLGEKQ